MNSSRRREAENPCGMQVSKAAYNVENPLIGIQGIPITLPHEQSRMRRVELTR